MLEHPENPWAVRRDAAAWGVTLPAPPPERANWGYRVGAYAVDAAVPLAVGFAVTGLADPLTSQAARPSDLGVIAMFLTWFLITAPVMWRTNGRTLGKAIAGIRVRRLDGKPVGFWFSILRDDLCRLVYVVPFAAGADAFLPLGSDRRGLRDRMVRTEVVSDPAGRWVPVLVAAVVALAATGGLGSGTIDEWDTERSDFVTDCQRDGTGESACECAFAAFADGPLTEQLLQADDAEPLPTKLQADVDATYEDCEKR